MDISAISQVMTIAANAAASSDALFDLARVSAPFGKGGLVNGWIVMGIGALVIATCLIVIVSAISYLPKALVLYNKFFPEKSDKNKVKGTNTPSAPIEAVAAAVAISYHNYQNNGK